MRRERGEEGKGHTYTMNKTGISTTVAVKFCAMGKGNSKIDSIVSVGICVEWAAESTYAGENCSIRDGRI